MKIGYRFSAWLVQCTTITWLKLAGIRKVEDEPLPLKITGFFKALLKYNWPNPKTIRPDKAYGLSCFKYLRIRKTAVNYFGSVPLPQGQSTKGFCVEIENSTAGERPDHCVALACRTMPWAAPDQYHALATRDYMVFHATCVLWFNLL